MAASLQDVRNLLNDTRRDLFDKPNVVATGVGYKVVNGKKTPNLGIICSVDNKVAKASLSSRELLPATIQNVPVDVLPSGPIYALQDPTDKYRPAPGGVSAGHFQITAGTLGCWVKKNGEFYMLSNNHVLANINAASIGDAILQPGPFDGGVNPGDQIANLSEFIPIDFGDGSGGNGSACPIAGLFASTLNALASLTGSKTRLAPVVLQKTTAAQTAENLVDAAIAKPLNETDVLNEILNIGAITGTAEGLLGMNIKKMGRTTGFTTGNIDQIDATVTVNYGAGKNATFVDQLIAGAMSQGGDSGSAMINDDNKLVGLLFAGSNTTTIFNRIQNVFSALNISLA